MKISTRDLLCLMRVTCLVYLGLPTSTTSVSDAAGLGEAKRGGVDVTQLQVNPTNHGANLGLVLQVDIQFGLARQHVD